MMKNMGKAIRFVVMVLICTIALSACSSHSRVIARMNKNLEQRPCWATASEYDYVFEDVTLKVSEYMKFKDGKYVCVQQFLSDGSVLFEVRTHGKYEIEYDPELESYFLSQYGDDNYSIKNINTNDDWYKKFELEYRLNYRGDAYDAIESDDDDDTLTGYEIIECTPDRFILKDLEDLEVYDYQAMGLDMTQEGATTFMR